MSPQASYLSACLESGVLVLTVTRSQIEGEDCAQGLKEELLALVARHDAHKIVIDLSQTRYVSSIAFWPLLALRKRLQATGGRLFITGLTGTVRDVFESTRMIGGSGVVDAPFEVAPDRATAVAWLNGAGEP